MRRTTRLIATLAALALAGPALAQMGMGTGGGMAGTAGPSGAGRPSGQGPARAAPPPPPVASPEVWPRLDPGAVFCRSAEDLRAHEAAAANPGMDRRTPGCVTVGRMTGIRILSRQGNVTQVEVVGPRPQTGWTDAWLPERRGTAAPGPQGGPPPGQGQGQGSGQGPRPPR